MSFVRPLSAEKIRLAPPASPRLFAMTMRDVEIALPSSREGTVVRTRRPRSHHRGVRSAALQTQGASDDIPAVEASDLLGRGLTP
jgi:hypothetical protein